MEENITLLFAHHVPKVQAVFSFIYTSRSELV